MNTKSNGGLDILYMEDITGWERKHVIEDGRLLGVAIEPGTGRVVVVEADNERLSSGGHPF